VEAGRRSPGTSRAFGCPSIVARARSPRGRIPVGLLIVLPALAAGTGCRSHGQPASSRRAPHPAPQPPAEEHYEISFFRALADKGGPAAILDGLYVAPPSIFPSLMTGIASGGPDWLALYRELRVEAARQNHSATVEQLDDGLARALGGNAAGVLRLARVHPSLPLAEICSRPAPIDQDRADVLDARELLGAVRRERLLERVTDRDLRALRDACLEPTRALVRRQLRIYLASYGAPDAAPASAPFGGKLSDPEQRELDSVLATARKDGALQARRDGRFPDGPFRIAQIPPAVLACCLDDAGRVANPEGPWEFSDCLTDERVPRARLLNACKINERLWDITFETGGFTTRHLRVRARLTEGGWTFARRDPVERPLSAKAVARDDWPDCNALAAD